MFWVLATALIIVNLLLDILEIIMNLLDPVALIGFALGLVFSFIIEPIAELITSLILIIMGGDLGYRALAKSLVVYTIGIIAEFIPILDALPLRTITLIVAILLIYRDIRVKRKTEEELLKQEEIEKVKEEKLYQPIT